MHPSVRRSFCSLVHGLANHQVSLLIGQSVPGQCMLARNSVNQLVLWSVSQSVSQSVSKISLLLNNQPVSQSVSQSVSQ